MIRWATVALGVLLFAGQAGGLTLLAAATTCNQPCADDDSDGRCAPTCVCLGCCSYRAPAVIGPAVAGNDILIARSASVETEPFLPFPDPHEILHIPKAHSV